MGMPTIHVFTHDSIGVGEDGPTHQPIEQLMSLRAIPNMFVLRPGDANEVTEAWKVIAKFQHTPACLLLTRQALPTLDRTKYAPAAGVAKGGYVLADAAGGKPDVILIGTGSEVHAVRRGVREADGRRDQGPRGEPAVVGAVREAAAGVPRLGDSAGGDGARDGGDGDDARAGSGTPGRRGR